MKVNRLGEEVTEKQVKNMSIRIWKWLYNNPTKRKFHLPAETIKKVEQFDYFLCPLCFLYEDTQCRGCIIYEENAGCNKNKSYYKKWFNSKDPDTKKKYAGLILEIIRGWDV